MSDATEIAEQLRAFIVKSEADVLRARAALDKLAPPPKPKRRVAATTRKTASKIVRKP